VEIKNFDRQVANDVSKTYRKEVEIFSLYKSDTSVIGALTLWAMLSLEKQLILGSKSFFISVKPVND
jgi:hypothetical protein